LPPTRGSNDLDFETAITNQIAAVFSRGATADSSRPEEHKQEHKQEQERGQERGQQQAGEQEEEEEKEAYPPLSAFRAVFGSESCDEADGEDTGSGSDSDAAPPKVLKVLKAVPEQPDPPAAPPARVVFRKPQSKAPAAAAVGMRFSTLETNKPTPTTAAAFKLVDGDSSTCSDSGSESEPEEASKRKHKAKKEKKEKKEKKKSKKKKSRKSER
jgi:hypothetical protein